MYYQTLKLLISLELDINLFRLPIYSIFCWFILFQFKVTKFYLIESIYSTSFTSNFSSKFGIIFLTKFEQNILHIIVNISPSLKSYYGFWVELWCAFVLEPLFLSLVCVCVCLFLKKKIWVIVPYYLKECVVCSITATPSLKVTMTFEWSYGIPLC